MRPSLVTLGSPVFSSITGGIRPSWYVWTPAFEVNVPPGVPDLSAETLIAIMPGRMTRIGKSILGNAAISGVRRAEVIESAAMARCTTRKSVHQYPKESTNPRPIERPNHSTPMGFEAALPIWLQDSV